MPPRRTAAEDLFGPPDDSPPAGFVPPGFTPAGTAPAAPRPLADRLRPRDLSEVVGQEHLLGPEGALGRMLGRGALASLILWGPPGVGKTTIARLLADAAGLRFAALSAVFSGVADLKRAFDEARARRGAGQATLLFVDEIHRFNRAQQDGFLPVVEEGTVVLVGATTENPNFALNNALLSRCRVLTLRRLDDAALERLLGRAEAEGAPLPVTAEGRAALRAMADGDGRNLLNMAEQLLALPEGTPPLPPEALPALLSRRPARDDVAVAGQDSQISPTILGDRGSLLNGLLSAFHKSLRGSDVQAALYYAARMMVMGEETAPTIFRRLACASSEDVGMADPQALPQVLACWDAFRRVGWPEGHLFMGQAIAYVATAPKSNATHLAFSEALRVAERTEALRPPLPIQNGHTKILKDLGHGAGYRYDHDEPDAFAGQEFFPDALAGENRPEFYRPTPRGFEREVEKRLEFWARRRGRR